MRGVPGWVSLLDDERQGSTAALQRGGVPDGGGPGLLKGYQQGSRWACNPGLLASEPGMMVALGSTHNSLLDHSSHQDNLHCVYIKKRAVLFYVV